MSVDCREHQFQKMTKSPHSGVTEQPEGSMVYSDSFLLQTSRLIPLPPILFVFLLKIPSYREECN